jgi:hypothetical protein
MKPDSTYISVRANPTVRTRIAEPTTPHGQCAIIAKPGAHVKTIKETLHLARILTLAAASCFAFWACAPMMSTPPATPMDPQATPEYGHGVWGGALLHSEQPTNGLGGYQYYRRAPIGESGRNESGIMIGAGWPSGLTLGGLYRLGLIKSETSYLGLQGAGGLVWLQGSLPAAVKIAEGTWLTTQPSCTWSMLKAVRVPIGMSIERKKFGRLDAEFGVQFLLASPNMSDFPDVLDSLQTGNDIAPYIGIGYAKAFNTASTSSSWMD